MDVNNNTEKLKTLLSNALLTTAITPPPPQKNSVILEYVTMEKMSEHLDNSLTLGELIIWIGIWFLFTNVLGYARKYVWKNMRIRLEESAPFDEMIL